MQRQLDAAQEHGNNIGQTGLAQYVLLAYGDELSPKLARFLQKVADNGYVQIGNKIHKAPEDIAAGLSDIFEKAGF